MIDIRKAVTYSSQLAIYTSRGLLLFSKHTKVVNSKELFLGAIKLSLD